MGLQIIGQHRLAKPSAQKRARDQLGAGTRVTPVVEQQAIAVIVIAAAFTDQGMDFSGLPGCHADGRASLQILDDLDGHTLNDAAVHDDVLITVVLRV